MMNLDDKSSIPCSIAPWKGKTIPDSMRITASVDSLFREDTKTIGISRVIFGKSVPRSLAFLKFFVLGSAIPDEICWYF